MISFFEEMNIKPKFTMVGEPTNCEINTIANGCYEFEIDVKGKSCHSSLIDQGINAINIMAKLITFIEDEQKKFQITSNCGVVLGGDIVNRVPDCCKMKFDVRSIREKEVCEFLKSVLNKIKLLENEYKTKIKIKKLLEIPPLEEKNKDIINLIAKNLNLKTSKFSGGCEAGYYQKLSGDAIIFGVGDIGLAHKPNEFVDINEYEKYSDLFLKILNEIGEKYYN